MFTRVGLLSFAVLFIVGCGPDDRLKQVDVKVTGIQKFVGGTSKTDVWFTTHAMDGSTKLFHSNGSSPVEVALPGMWTSKDGSDGVFAVCGEGALWVVNKKRIIRFFADGHSEEHSQEAVESTTARQIFGDGANAYLFDLTGKHFYRAKAGAGFEEVSYPPFAGTFDTIIFPGGFFARSYEGAPSVMPKDWKFEDTTWTSVTTSDWKFDIHRPSHWESPTDGWWVNDIGIGKLSKETMRREYTTFKFGHYDGNGVSAVEGSTPPGFRDVSETSTASYEGQFNLIPTKGGGFATWSRRTQVVSASDSSVATSIVADPWSAGKYGAHQTLITLAACSEQCPQVTEVHGLPDHTVIALGGNPNQFSGQVLEISRLYFGEVTP